MQEQGRAQPHQLLHQWQPGRLQGLRERQGYRRLALEYMVGVPLYSCQARTSKCMQYEPVLIEMHTEAGSR